MQLQRDLITAQTTQVHAKADYNKAVSQLRFTDSSLLDAHKITFEYK